MTVEVFAPAKINLTLHVTGRRDDGYHLLDSLVVFADIGDRITLSEAAETSLRVTGPCDAGVPDDVRNLCWQAAERFGTPVAITLDKHLPAAAGIGGGSSDAAAVLRGLVRMTGRTLPFDPLELGADLPVCMAGRAARMRGIGEQVTPVDLPAIDAVLVNPGVGVSTPAIFDAMTARDNPPMPEPPIGDAAAVIDWLADQRNDLQPAAMSLVPAISEVLTALAPARLARMSGSGATCFGLCDDAGAAGDLADEIAEDHPDWWVQICRLS